MFNTQYNHHQSIFPQCPIPNEKNCRCGDIGLLPSYYLEPTNTSQAGLILHYPIRIVHPNTEPLFKRQKKNKNACK